MAESYRGSKSRRPNSKRRKGNSRRRDDADTGVRPRKGKICDQDESEVTSRGSLNDLSWYTKNPALIGPASAFPYPNRPGMSIPVGVNPNASGWNGNYSIPGVLAINWMPSFGYSQNDRSPVSIAAQEIYARVRAAYSGALDADAPDYITYLGALDSIFTYIGWLKRVYRALSTYSDENFSMPSALLQAMGLTPAQAQDLRSEKTLFLQDINELVLASRKFKCPAVMDIFNRHYWMSDNVYADAPSPRAQLFIYNLAGVFKVTELTIDTEGNTAQGLKMTPIPSWPATGVRSAMFTFGNSLLTALNTWDDSHTISGYLMRAYQDTPTFAVAELLQGEQITAAYEPEVLAQIENCRVVLPVSVGLDIADISGSIVTQNTIANTVLTSNSIKFSLAVTDATNAMSGYDIVPPFINIRSDNPTLADTVIATRMQTVVYSVTQGSSGSGSSQVYNYTIRYISGTEIALNMVMYTNVDSAGTVVSRRVPSILTVNFAGTALTSNPAKNTFTAIGTLMDLANFDWHPLVFVFVTDGSGNTTTHICGDVHNPTTVTKDMLENLHRVCVYSELNAFNL